MKLDTVFSVEGARVIVTGAASGLGLAFTEAMAESGAQVAMLDLNREALDAQFRRLRSLGYSVRSHVLDVTDRDAVDDTFNAVAAGFGGLDIVFANAGIDQDLDSLHSMPQGNENQQICWKNTRTIAGGRSSPSA